MFESSFFVVYSQARWRLNFATEVQKHQGSLSFFKAWRT